MVMLTRKLHDAINQQINAELYSAYLYLSMQAYLLSVNLPGSAKWMSVQVQEEWAHAMKLFNYLKDKGARILMKPIDGPPTEWASPVEIFEYTYQHEKKVTGLINQLVQIAGQENDSETSNFLQWYVKEQEEEEESAGEILARLKQIAGDPKGISALDQELAKRVFHPPE
jgi:ferritin